MLDQNKAFIIDTCVWISSDFLSSYRAKRLLQYIVSRDFTLLIPEIIEIEISNYYKDLIDEKLAEMKRAVRAIEKVFHHQISINAKQYENTTDVILTRMNQVTGSVNVTKDVLETIIAYRAMRRVTEARPPSNKENQQAKDCLIWEYALEISKARSVVFITEDNGYFSKNVGSDKKHLKEILDNEILEGKYGIVVYNGLDAYLNEHLQEEKIKLTLEEECEIESQIIEEFDVSSVYEEIEVEEIIDSEPEISIQEIVQPGYLHLIFSILITVKGNIASAMRMHEYIKFNIKGDCKYDCKKKQISEVVFELAEATSDYYNSTSYFSPTRWIDKRKRTISKHYHRNHVTSFKRK